MIEEEKQIQQILVHTHVTVYRHAALLRHLIRSVQCLITISHSIDGVITIVWSAQYNEEITLSEDDLSYYFLSYHVLLYQDEVYTL